jgi:TRAP-type mannitol/chloroaromatic compound transport system permease small subunit
MNASPACRLRNALDHLIAATTGLARFLVLAVSLLLFLQWPLRELVHAYSREANDVAQWLFALYISAAVTHATRVKAHPAAHALAHRYSEHVRAVLARVASLIVLLPWSLFILVTAGPAVWQSVSQLESFPETYNPGYFLVKLAAWGLALLVFLQAVADLLPQSTTEERGIA